MKCNITLKKLLLALLLLIVVLPAVSQSCTTGKVDDRVAEFLKLSASVNAASQSKAHSAQELRNEGPKVFVKLPDDSVKRVKISANTINVNVIRPTANSNLPVIINFHSGGFVTPLMPWMEYEGLRLAKKFNAVVFDVDYRVAPEQKFPTAVTDAYSAYQWVLQHAKEYGGDPSKIILNGTGSGATLVALLTHKLKKEGKPSPIKLAIMICPYTDNPLTSYYTSYEDNAKGYGLTKEQATFYVQSYLEKTEWYKSNPAIWPIYEADFTGLPPTLIITTEFDVLRDEGIAYGKKLEKTGNTVSIKCFPHQIHSFEGLPQESGEMKRVYELMGEMVAKSIK